jgi:hypothetical protein
MSNKKPVLKLKSAPKPETVEALKKLSDVKGVENTIEFMRKLDDKFFGFSSERQGLLDILPKPEDEYNFLEVYYDSDAATKNRQLSENQIDRFAKLRSEVTEDSDHILNKVMFKDIPEVRKILIENIQDLIGGQD